MFQEFVKSLQREENKSLIEAVLKGYRLLESIEYPLEDPPLYGDSDYKKRAGNIVYISPDKFLNLIRPLKIDEESAENIEILMDRIQKGETIDPPTLYIKNGKISSHDGRHRAYAAKNMGVEKIPVLIIDEDIVTKHEKLPPTLEAKSKAKSKYEKLEKNKVPLTDEERKEVFKKDAVWHYGTSKDPNTGRKVQKVSAVWKSKDPKTGKVTYITQTHRAYNTAPTLKGIIGRYHDFIKGTA